MIQKNYKKIAILNYKSNPVAITKQRLTWKLNFKPSKLIVCLSLDADNEFSNNTFSLIPNPLENNIKEMAIIRPTSADALWQTVKSFDENGMTWTEKYGFGEVNRDLIKITYVIAIE